MPRRIAQAMVLAAATVAVLGACGSGDAAKDAANQAVASATSAVGAPGQSSASGSAAPSESGAPASSSSEANGDAAGGEAAQKVKAAIDQAAQQSPITFASEQSELSSQAKQGISQIAAAMQGNDVKVLVATHAGYPDAAKSKALSTKRAEVIAAALESAGVAKDRITTEATGNEKAQGDQALDTQISVAQ